MYNSDLLDEYCMNVYGHTDWEYTPSKYGIRVFFHEEDREEPGEGDADD